MNISLAILFAILGGICNGSFNSPKHYLKGMSDSKTWLLWSFWGLLFIPIFLSLISGANLLQLFLSTKVSSILVVLLSGFIYGLSFIFFLKSIPKIGSGVAFIINVGFANVLVNFFALFNTTQSSHYTFVLYQSLSIVLYIIALILAIKGNLIKHKFFLSKRVKSSGLTTHKKGDFIIGVLFAFIAAIGSFVEIQGFSIGSPLIIKSLTQQEFYTQFSMAVIPSLILAFGMFFPFLIYFCKKQFFTKNLSTASTDNKITARIKFKNICITILMGALFFIALILLQGSDNFAGNASAITGATFLTCIILVSNIWEWIRDEWKDTPKTSYLLVIAAIIIFISANIASFLATL